jgi:hypothetical protein
VSYLRLETATPSETERAIEQQAREIKELCETLALIQKKFGDMEKHLSELKKVAEQVNTKKELT